MNLEPGVELPELAEVISRDRIAAYAEASGDRNPIHLDDAFARSVGLPGVIAHGMLQMGILGRLVAAWAGDHRRVRRLSCRFAGMVRPGDSLTCGGRLAAVEDGIATLELWARTGDGTLVLSKGIAEVSVGY